MFRICRETISEGINYYFTYNEWFDANFSNLEAFYFLIIIDF